jgi:hypothetical protein
MNVQPHGFPLAGIGGSIDQVGSWILKICPANAISFWVLVSASLTRSHGPIYDGSDCREQHDLEESQKRV